MTSYSVLEVIQVLLASAGAGLSAMGWTIARREHQKNLLDGVNGSIGMTAVWRISRERDRLIKQMLILVSGLIVVNWRLHHPGEPVLVIYVTRNFTLVLLSGLLMLDSITDWHTRQTITEVVRSEKLRFRRRALDLAPGQVVHTTRQEVHESTAVALTGPEQLASAVKTITKETETIDASNKHIAAESQALSPTNGDI